MKLSRLLAAATTLSSVFAANPAHADETGDQPAAPSELYVSIGIGSAQEFSSIIAGSIVDVVGGTITGSPPMETSTSTGAIAIGYNHYLAPRWTLGAIVNYERTTRTATFSDGTSTRAQDTYLTAMARTDFRWLDWQYLQIYSGLALGGNYIHSVANSTNTSSSNGLIWAFQANALGARVGHTIGAFVELGFGWNGILTAGVSARF